MQICTSNHALAMDCHYIITIQPYRQHEPLCNVILNAQFKYGYIFIQSCEQHKEATLVQLTKSPCMLILLMAMWLSWCSIYTCILGKGKTTGVKCIDNHACCTNICLLYTIVRQLRICIICI